MSDVDHRGVWMPVDGPSKFDLEAAKLEGLKRQWLADFHRALFSDGDVARPVPPPTWRDRVRRARRRTAAYLSTLGKALRGDDPDEDWA